MEQGRSIRRFSEEVRKRVVEEIESGSVSIAEAASRYGAPKSSVKNWLQEYGAYRPQRNIVEVVMKDDEEKLTQMERALSEAHLKIRVYEQMIELAKKEYKIDLKKNYSTKALESLKEKEPKSK